MRYVICYDISDDKRRHHLVEALLDFGKRVQESVFVAELDAKLAEMMEDRIGKAIDELTDAVHIFKLCEGCAGRVRLFGQGRLTSDEDYYVL